MTELKEIIENEINKLEIRLADLQARLPAHSIPPSMMAEMDDLEDLLSAAKAQLQQEKHKELK